MPTIPVTTESIDFYYKQLTSRNGIYEENRLYGIGKNPQIHRMTPTKDPDNRLSIPLAKSAIADMTGYAGSERTIEIDNIETDETAREEHDMDEFISAVDEVYRFNNTDQLTSQIFKEALTQGVAYEIVFTRSEVSLDGIQFVPEYAMVKGNQILPIFSNDLKPALLAFIWFRSVFENDNEIVLADVYYGTIATSNGDESLEGVERQIQRFRRTNGTWTRDPEGDSIHIFDRPPLNIYRINDEQLSMFEAEKGMLFSLDKLLSKSINEIDRFNANILIIPGMLTDEDLVRIKEWSIIIGKTDAGESDPAYLSKPLGDVDSFYNALADRMERLFHKSVKVPDFSDENFVGNSSGVALAFKLLGLEFLATQIDSFFDMGVRDRYDLIVQALNFGRTSPRFDISSYELSIINQRNLPVDNETRVRIAQLLTGIVSRETLLRFIPNEIVDNAEREIQRLRDEGAVADPIDIDVDETVETDMETGLAIGAAQGDVQRQALNGAQIGSIVELALQVSTGQLPRDTAVEIVLTAIPGMSRDQAEAIFEDITPMPPQESIDNAPAV